MFVDGKPRTMTEETEMKRLIAYGIFVVLVVFLLIAPIACSNSDAQQDAPFPQIPVPAGGMGQHIIARNYLGVDCATPFIDNQPSITGFGTAALYFPYVAGIPDDQLFLEGTDLVNGRNETNSVLTAVFSKVVASQTQNATVRATFLEDHFIYYYYHPDSGADFNDLESFMAGELVSVNHIQTNMFTEIIPFGISFVTNSGPWSFSRDFTLRNGDVANLATFMPGGITVHVLGHVGQPVVDETTGFPVVLDVRETEIPDGPDGAASTILGDCSIMSPFAGSGTAPAPAP
jgi:hypothetical protein